MGRLQQRPPEIRRWLQSSQHRRYLALIISVGGHYKVLAQFLPCLVLILTNESHDLSAHGSPKRITKGNDMNKRITKVVGGAAVIGALALAAATGTGTASAQSLIAKAGITKPAHEGRGPAKSLASVAGVLKLTEVELKAQLDSGKSLAAVAATQNVSVQSVIDVIVAEKQAHMAEEVASGEMTQAQADAKLAEVTTKVTEMVNSVRPAGMGEGKHGGKGHGGKGGRGGRGQHGAENTNA
jgi:hypothetical protein